jgi:hypothetical protein
MSSFKDQLDNAYKKKVVETLEKATRSVAFVVDAELVARTPVDTGRARSNWLPTLNIPSEKTVGPNEKVDVGRVLEDYSLDDNILITNNLPYIERLNQGSSKQAPANFVEAAVQFGVSKVR